MTNELPKKKKRTLKPLLVAGTGVALLSMTALGCAEYTGNPMPCQEGEPETSACWPVHPDAGTDGGTP